MSLSLDGRLPSSRRAALLRHIAACTGCRASWEEMRGAQQLAFTRAKTFKPRAGFRENLQERIASGEAAPEAIYSDPATTATRRRYLLTGAAAAAIFLVGYKFASVERDAAAPDAIATIDALEAQGGEIAEGGAVVPIVPRLRRREEGEGRLRETPRSVQRRRMPPQLATATLPWRPADEFELARAGVRYTVARADEVRAQWVARDGRFTADAWRNVEPRLAELRAAVQVMQFMARRDIVQLSSQTQRELERAAELVAESAGAPADRRSDALGEIASLRFDELRRQLNVKCCRPPADLACDLQDLMTTVPRVSQILSIKIVQPNDQTFESVVPAGRATVQVFIGQY